jgi:hypothetical protein
MVAPICLGNETHRPAAVCQNATHRVKGALPESLELDDGAVFEDLKRQCGLFRIGEIGSHPPAPRCNFRGYFSKMATTLATDISESAKEVGRDAEI